MVREVGAATVVLLREVMDAGDMEEGMAGRCAAATAAAATINGTRATTTGTGGTAATTGGGGRALARAGAGATTGRVPGAAGATTGTGTGTVLGGSAAKYS